MASISYITEEELKKNLSYEGDEEDYIDDVKNFPRKCSNTTTYTMNKISNLSLDDEQKYNPNVILFIRNEGQRIECFLYSELKEMLNKSQPVFLWEGGDLGRPLEDRPIYLFPFNDPNEPEVWFDGNYGMLSRYSAFLLYDPKQYKTGSSFSASSRHGSLEYVWKVRPISKVKFLDEGIITDMNTVFHDKLDFAPGNYPGGEVEIFVKPGTSRCFEKQGDIMNVFYESGDSYIGKVEPNNNINALVRMSQEFDKMYNEDDSFEFSGEREISIEYSDPIKWNNSSLVVTMLPDKSGVIVTFTQNGNQVWRETIKGKVKNKFSTLMDAIVEGDIDSIDDVFTMKGNISNEQLHEAMISAISFENPVSVQAMMRYGGKYYIDNIKTYIKESIALGDEDILMVFLMIDSNRVDGFINNDNGDKISYIDYASVIGNVDLFDLINKFPTIQNGKKLLKLLSEHEPRIDEIKEVLSRGVYNELLLKAMVLSLKRDNKIIFDEVVKRINEDDINEFINQCIRHNKLDLLEKFLSLWEGTERNIELYIHNARNASQEVLDLLNSFA